MEIGNYCCHILDIWSFVFIEMFTEKSSMFHIEFVQIAELDWLPGQHKG